MCTAFVFAALVEFTCVNYLWRMKSNPYLKFGPADGGDDGMGGGGGSPRMAVAEDADDLNMAEEGNSAKVAINVEGEMDEDEEDDDEEEEKHLQIDPEGLDKKSMEMKLVINK